MWRLTRLLVLFAGLTVSDVRGDDNPILAQAFALEQSLQNAIREAEPSVACIIVSRSEVYKRLFHDEPPADSPGKLGAFVPPAKVPPDLESPGRKTRPEQDVQKYDLADPNYVPEAYGSGVVIDGQQLLVLTTYHLVRNASKVYVRLPDRKGSYADIHAADPRSDLAVLRLLDGKLRPLKEAKFGDSAGVQKGQFIVALANPFAAGFRDESPSASWGIISNIRRRAASAPPEEELKQLRPLHSHPVLLQIDARMNPGCSGGAIVNLRGEMIGLTTARAALSGSETAGSFAIPLDAGVKRIIGKLREGVEVEYGFLGVEQYLGLSDGLHIRVQEGSPAQKAGIHSDDVIVAINGSPVRDFDDLFLTVSTQLAGSEVSVKLAKRPKTVTVNLAKSYVPGKIMASKKPPAVRGFRVDYTSVLLMKNALGLARGHSVVPAGVFVSEVQPGSPAAAVRLHENDVITHVDGHQVNTPAEFYQQAAKIDSSVPMELTLVSEEWHKKTVTKLKIPGTTTTSSH